MGEIEMQGDPTTRRAVVWLLSVAMLAVLVVATPARAEQPRLHERDQAELSDCSEQVVVRGVDPAELGVRLPDGFALRSTFGLGEGLAEVGTFSIECREEGVPVTEVYEMLAVDAPEGQAIGETDWILLRGTTTRSRSWTRWVSWCFVGAMSSGRADQTLEIEDGVRHGQVDVDSRRGDLLMTTSVPADGVQVPSGSAGLFAVRNGEVVGRALWQWEASLLSIGGGSLTHEGQPVEPVAFGVHSYAPDGADFGFTFTGLTSTRGGCSR